MPFVQVETVRFHYEVMGVVQHQPPIIFIAGYVCDIEFWRPVAEHVAQHTQVLIFDNQGIGQTVDDDAPLSIESMSQHTKGLVDALVEQGEFASGPYVVAGFAMGGVIAQHWAAHFPEYTHQLVLLNSVLRFNREAQYQAEQMYLARVQGDFIRYAEIVYHVIFDQRFHAQHAEATFVPQFAQAVEPIQTVDDQRRQLDVLKTCDARAFAPNIQAPTVLIQSRPRDVFSLPEEGEALAEALESGGASVTCHEIISGHDVVRENFPGLLKIMDDKV